MRFFVCLQRRSVFSNGLGRAEMQLTGVYMKGLPHPRRMPCLLQYEVPHRSRPTYTNHLRSSTLYPLTVHNHSQITPSQRELTLKTYMHLRLSFKEKRTYSGIKSSRMIRMCRTIFNISLVIPCLAPPPLQLRLPPLPSPSSHDQIKTTV